MLHGFRHLLGGRAGADEREGLQLAITLTAHPLTFTAACMTLLKEPGSDAPTEIHLARRARLQRGNDFFPRRGLAHDARRTRFQSAFGVKILFAPRTGAGAWASLSERSAAPVLRPRARELVRKQWPFRARLA
jgi:hypothetical protein